MKFLLDVHISFKLLSFLSEIYPETKHVNTLQNSFFSSDSEIIEFADNEDYIIITKDKDFKHRFLISKKPKKLIKINLGNLSNKELIELFRDYLTQIDFIHSKYNSFMIEIQSQQLTISV